MLVLKLLSVHHHFEGVWGREQYITHLREGRKWRKERERGGRKGRRKLRERVRAQAKYILGKIIEGRGR